MSDTVIIAAIAAIPPTLAALLALVKSIKVEKAVQEVHLSVNSRLDQLLKSTSLASHAEGMKAERSKHHTEANGTD